MVIKLYALYRKDIAECLEVIKTTNSSVDEIAGRFMFAYFVALNEAMKKADGKLPLAVGDNAPFADIVSMGNTKTYLTIGVVFRPGHPQKYLEMELPFGDHPVILVKPLVF